MLMKRNVSGEPRRVVAAEALRRPRAEAALRAAERRDVRRTVSGMASAMQALLMKRNVSGEPRRVVAAEALRRPKAEVALVPVGYADGRAARCRPRSGDLRSPGYGRCMNARQSVQT